MKKTFETEGQWKRFNSFERKDYRHLMKERLLEESQQVIQSILKNREAKRDSIFDGTATSWRVPVIEHHDKIVGDEGRFFNLFEHQKSFGKKYVPPPVADSIKQLLDDQKLATIRSHTSNLLLNTRYAK